LAPLDLYIAGQKQGYVSTSFSEEPSLPTTFDAELDPTATVNPGAAVQIREGADTLFKGVVDGIEHSQQFRLQVRGRDNASLKLHRFAVDEEAFDDTEPLEICKVLLTPNKECGAALIHEDDFKTDDGYWFARRTCTKGIGQGRMYVADSKEGEGDDFFLWIKRTFESASQPKLRVLMKPLSRFNGKKTKTVDGETVPDYKIAVGLMHGYDSNSEYLLYIGSDDGDPTNRKLVLSKRAGNEEYVKATQNYMFQWDRTYEMELVIIGKHIVGKIRESGQAEWTLVTHNDESQSASGTPGVLCGAAIAEFRFYRHVHIGIATASSNSGDAPNAIDEDPDTYWESGTADMGAWWQCQLGANGVSNLTRLRFKIGGNPIRVLVYVAQTPDYFIQVYDNQDPKESYIEVVFDPPDYPVKYVKITMTKQEGKTVIVHECKLFQATEGGPLLEYGTMTEYGSGVDFESQDEPRDEALKRLADAVNFDVWTDVDEKISFGVRGNQTPSLTFSRGANIYSLDRTREVDRLLYKVRVLGWGERWAQLKVEAIDESVKNAYPQLAAEHVEDMKDIADPDLLQEIADKILNARKTVLDQLALLLDGEAYSRTEWQAGDAITIQDSELGVNGAYRVMRLVTHGFPPVCEVDAAPWDQTRYGEQDIEAILRKYRKSIQTFEKMGRAASESPIVKPLSEIVGGAGGGGIAKKEYTIAPGDYGNNQTVDLGEFTENKEIIALGFEVDAEALADWGNLIARIDDENSSQMIQFSNEVQWESEDGRKTAKTPATEGSTVTVDPTLDLHVKAKFTTGWTGDAKLRVYEGKVIVYYVGAADEGGDGGGGGGGELKLGQATRECELAYLDEAIYEAQNVPAWSYKSKCIAKLADPMSDAFKLSKLAFALWGVMETELKVEESGDAVRVMVIMSEHEPTVGEEISNTPANNFVVHAELSSGDIWATDYYKATGKTIGTQAYSVTPGNKFWMSFWLVVYNGYGTERTVKGYSRNMRSMYLVSTSCFGA